MSENKMAELVGDINHEIEQGKIRIETIRRHMERSIADATFIQDFQTIEQQARDIQEILMKIQMLKDSVRAIQKFSK